MPFFGRYFTVKMIYDKLIITYNFAPPTETVAIDAKATIEIEKQSESAFSFYQNYSSILSKGAPKRTHKAFFFYSAVVEGDTLTRALVGALRLDTSSEVDARKNNK